MRMLRVIEFLSLDGVMQAPGDPEEDTEGGFRHGGWQRPYFDEVLGASAAEGMAATDAYLFGRKLGSGKRLFREADHPKRLSLVDSKITGTGGVLSTYGRRTQ
jgi:hypothetical protein